MISHTEIHRKLKRELGDKVYFLVPPEFYEEVITEESLQVFSEYYPMLVDVRLTVKDAVPFVDYSGKMFKYRQYRLPEIYGNSATTSKEKLVWREIENYYVPGNDTTDVFTGGNVLLNTMFLQARSTLPHTRSYYTIKFEEPDILLMTPELVTHRDFYVQMQANRTLNTVPRSMQTYFKDLVVCDVKLAIYNKFKYSTGTQFYGGFEIDTKLDDFKDAESRRSEIIQIFEKDWFLNPERFEVQMLYNYK